MAFGSLLPFTHLCSRNSASRMYSQDDRSSLSHSSQSGAMVSPQKGQALGLSHPLPVPYYRSFNTRQTEQAQKIRSLFPHSASTCRKKSLQAPLAYTTAEIRTLTYYWWDFKILQLLWKALQQFLKRFNMVAIRLSNYTPENIPRKVKVYIHTKTCMPMFTAAFIIAKNIYQLMNK